MLPRTQSYQNAPSGETNAGLFEDITTRSLNSVTIGQNAGKRLSGAARNVCAGYESARDGLNMTDTVALGYRAGATAQNVFSSVYIGSYAGASATGGNESVFAGFRSGEYNRDGTGLVGIGPYTLRENVAGSYSVASGYRAMERCLDGDFNAAHGAFALQDLRSASYVTSMGFMSGRGASRASESCYFGAYAGYCNAEGVGNSLFGYRAGEYVTGNYNCAVGYGALQYASGASCNIAIGPNAGSYLSGGSNTVTIGMNAGGYGGSRCVILGVEAGFQGTSNVDNSVLIGYRTGIALNSSNMVLIGAEVAAAGLNAPGAVLIGHQTGKTLALGRGNILIGPGVDTYNSINYNGIAIGTSNVYTSDYGVAVGTEIYNRRAYSVLVGYDIRTDANFSVLMGNHINLESVLFFKDPLANGYQDTVLFDGITKYGISNIAYPPTLYETAQLGISLSNIFSTETGRISRPAQNSNNYNLRSAATGAYIVAPGDGYLIALTSNAAVGANAIVSFSNILAAATDYGGAGSIAPSNYAPPSVYLSNLLDSGIYTVNIPLGPTPPPLYNFLHENSPVFPVRIIQRSQLPYTPAAAIVEPAALPPILLGPTEDVAPSAALSNLRYYVIAPPSKGTLDDTGYAPEATAYYRRHFYESTAEPDNATMRPVLELGAFQLPTPAASNDLVYYAASNVAVRSNIAPASIIIGSITRSNITLGRQHLVAKYYSPATALNITGIDANLNITYNGAIHTSNTIITTAAYPDSRIAQEFTLGQGILSAAAASNEGYYGAQLVPYITGAIAVAESLGDYTASNLATDILIAAPWSNIPVAYAAYSNYIITGSNTPALEIPAYETSNFTYGFWQYQNYIYSASNYIGAIAPSRAHITPYYYASVLVAQSTPSPSVLTLDAAPLTAAYADHASNLEYVYTQMPRLEGLAYSNITAGDLGLSFTTAGQNTAQYLQPITGVLGPSAHFAIPTAVLRESLVPVNQNTYIARPPIYGKLSCNLEYDAFYPWAYSNIDTASVVYYSSSNATLSFTSPYSPIFATGYTAIVKPKTISLDFIGAGTLAGTSRLPIGVSNITASNIYATNGSGGAPVYSTVIYEDLAGVYSSNTGYYRATSNVYVSRLLETSNLIDPVGSNTTYLVYSFSNLTIAADGSANYIETAPEAYITAGPTYNSAEPYVNSNIYNIYSVRVAHSNYLAHNTVINRAIGKINHISVYDGWGNQFLFSSNQSVNYPTPVTLSSNVYIAAGPDIYYDTSNIIENSNLRLEVPVFPYNKWYYSAGGGGPATGGFIKSNIGYVTTATNAEIAAKQIYLADFTAINGQPLNLNIITSPTAAQIVQNVQTVNLGHGFRAPMSVILGTPPAGADSFQILDHDTGACMTSSCNLVIRAGMGDEPNLHYLATENVAIDTIKYIWLSNQIPLGPVTQTTLFIERDPQCVMDINTGPSLFNETRLRDFYAARGAQGLRVRFFPTSALIIGGPGAGTAPVAMNNVLQTTITPAPSTGPGTYDLTYQLIPSNALTPVIAESTIPVRVYESIQWPAAVGTPSIEYDYYGNAIEPTEKYIGAIWDTMSNLRILDAAAPIGASNFNIIITGPALSDSHISSNADAPVSVYKFPIKTGLGIAPIPAGGATAASNETIKIRLEYQSNISPEYDLTLRPYYAPFPSVSKISGSPAAPSLSPALIADGFRWYSNIGLSNAASGELLVSAGAWSQSNYFGQRRVELAAGLTCNLTIDQADSITVPLPGLDSAGYYVLSPPHNGALTVTSNNILYQNDGRPGTSNDTFTLVYAQTPYDLSLGSIKYNFLVNPLPLVTENYELFDYTAIPFVPLNSNITLETFWSPDTHILGLKTPRTAAAFTPFTVAEFRAGQVGTYGSNGGIVTSTVSNPLRLNPLYSNLFLTEVKNYFNEYWSINEETPVYGSNMSIGYFIDSANPSSQNLVDKTVTISFNVRPSQPLSGQGFLESMKFVFKIGGIFHATFYKNRAIISINGGPAIQYSTPAFVFGQFTNVKFINNNANDRVSLYIGTTDILAAAQIPALPFTVAPSDIQILVNTRAPENYFGSSNFSVGSNHYNLVEYRTLIEYQDLEITATTYNIEDTVVDQATHNIVVGKYITVRGVDNICLGNSFSTSGKNSIIIGNDIGDTLTGQINDVYESIVIGNTSFQNSVVRDVIAIGRNLLNNLANLPAAPVISFFSKSPIIIGNSIDSSKLDFHVNIANTFAKTSVDGDQIYLGLSGEKVRIGYTSNQGATLAGANLAVTGAIATSESYGFAAPLGIPSASAGMAVTLAGAIAVDPRDPMIYGIIDDTLTNVIALGHAPCLLDAATQALGPAAGAPLYLSGITAGRLSTSNIVGAMNLGVYLGNNKMFVRVAP